MFHHFGMMHCLKKMHEKFTISKEMKDGQLVISIKGDKNDLEKLDKKLGALQTLTEGCCEGNDVCCEDGKDNCCC